MDTTKENNTLHPILGVRQAQPDNLVNGSRDKNTLGLVRQLDRFETSSALAFIPTCPIFQYSQACPHTKMLNL